MQTVIRSLPFVLLGVLSVACFSSSKTTKVEPGATNAQPVQCLGVGASCHSSSDCCTGSCSDNVCVQK